VIIMKPNSRVLKLSTFGRYPNQRVTLPFERKV
jgi:hypothetical protein